MTTILRFTVVDDFGAVINPMLLEGQVHGGVVQGIGQALLEETVYDEDNGQLLTGTFMDYAMPRADNLPNFSFATRNVPCKANPLGVKGAGEAGAVGAPPAVINAIVDALHAKGVRHVDMPATPNPPPPERPLRPAPLHRVELPQRLAIGGELVLHQPAIAPQAGIVGAQETIADRVRGEDPRAQRLEDPLPRDRIEARGRIADAQQRQRACRARCSASPPAAARAIRPAARPRPRGAHAAWRRAPA